MRLSLVDIVMDAEPDMVGVLDQCIQACVFAERGYATATEDARDPVMRALFHVYERQRADFASALRDATNELGGLHSSPRTRARPPEAFASLPFVARSSPQRAVDGTALDALVLEQAVRRDTAAVRIYAMALRCAAVPAEVRVMLSAHYAAIRDAVNDVLSRGASSARCIRQATLK